jgi:hypothetical protein
MEMLLKLHLLRQEICSSNVCHSVTSLSCRPGTSPRSVRGADRARWTHADVVFILWIASKSIAGSTLELVATSGSLCFDSARYSGSSVPENRGKVQQKNCHGIST